MKKYHGDRFRVQFFGGPAHQFIAGILRRKSGCQHLQRADGGNPVLRIRVLHMGYGEPQQRFQSPLFSEKLHRKRKYAVQKIEDRFAFQLLFFPEPLHEDFQHFLANPFRSPVDGGNHNKFQSVLDPPLLLQRQPVVRPDQPFQILLPQRPRGPVVRIRHIGGKLLPVSGVKVGEDLSDQRRRLPPDIPLPVQ